MPPKKNKGQKMDLSSFLADSTTGSWADEMEDMPVAPTIKDPNALKRGDPGYFESLPDRGARGAGGFDSSRPPRDELPLPTRPPYTAFVGNLDFETGEEDLKAFFEGLETVSAKIIRDHDSKPKGFGYVEFSSLDGLKDALTRSGGQLVGRVVRISVAEPPKEASRGFGASSSSGFGPSQAEESSQWRRAGPLPPRSPPPSNRRTFSSSDRPASGGDGIERDWSAARGSKFAPSASTGGSGFGGAPERERSSGFAQPDGVERDWSAARGTKFTPSAPGPSASGGFGGERSGSGFGAPRGGSGEVTPELPNDWRANRPARPTPPPSEGGMARGGSGAGGSRGGFIEREVGVPDNGEPTWSRGSKFQAAPPRPEARSGAGSPAIGGPEQEERGDWRAKRTPAVMQGSNEGSPVASAQASPVPARKALSLLPRSSSDSPAPASDESAPPAKSSPFGAARAVDTATKEKEASEKLAKMEETRKVEAEARQKAMIAEREKNAEAAKAAREAGGVQQQGRQGPAGGPGGPVLGSRFQPRGGAPGPGRGGFQQRPPHQQRTSGSGPPNIHPSRLPQAPVPQKTEKPAQAEPVVDEDGFVAPSGSALLSRKAKEEKEKAERERREREKAEEVKPGFSFAKAGLEVEGDDDEEVEEAREGVEAVKV